MARLTASERLWIGRLTIDRWRRDALSRLLYLPAFRWYFEGAGGEQMLIVPQDLRTADPSFWDELEIGEMGLAGTIAVIDDESPFDLASSNEAWTRALHSFEWLRHLEAVQRPEARETAREFTLDWIERSRTASGIAWEPPVLGRRIISWLSHSALLLDGADARTYDAVTRNLVAQLVRLSATWRNSPRGYPRLVTLTALVLADLCIAGRDRHISDAQSSFNAELARQILPDGGHVSRNPQLLIELMLDFLPLQQCFAARGRAPPPQLASAIQRMLAMLKHMRMGDGMLARFNGVSVAIPARLATVLAYDDRPRPKLAWSSPSRYVRLERGASTAIMDVGPPPPLEAAAEAHAGCLSIEFSTGTQLMLVNGGAPGPADADWRAVARATSSHNTLALGEKSSSKLVHHRGLEELAGGAPIRYPARVSSQVNERGGQVEAVAEHNGYEWRFGLSHRRTVVLSENGRRLVGIDRIDSPRGNVRLKRDLPYAIHFHLHPLVMCRRHAAENVAEIVLPDGAVWRFSIEGAELSIEDSTYFADSAGPRGSLQIVARGATFGQSEVRWVIEAAGP